MASCTACLVLIPIVLFLVYSVVKKFLGFQKVENLSKKYVLITGCDSGFGKLTAIQLDLLGFQVIATCLTEQGKEELEQKCSQRIQVFLLDVTNSKQIQQLNSDVSRLIPQDVGKN